MQIKMIDGCGRVPEHTFPSECEMLDYLASEQGIDATTMDSVLDNVAENGVGYLGEWEFHRA